MPTRPLHFDSAIALPNSFCRRRKITRASLTTAIPPRLFTVRKGQPQQPQQHDDSPRILVSQTKRHRTFSPQHIGLSHWVEKFSNSPSIDDQAASSPRAHHATTTCPRTSQLFHERSDRSASLSRILRPGILLALFSSRRQKKPQGRPWNPSQNATGRAGDKTARCANDKDRARRRGH